MKNFNFLIGTKLATQTFLCLRIGLFCFSSLVMGQYQFLPQENLVGYQANTTGLWQRVGSQPIDQNGFISKNYQTALLNYHPAFYIDQNNVFSLYGWYGFSPNQTVLSAFFVDNPKSEQVIWSMEASNGTKIVQTTNRHLENNIPRLDLVKSKSNAQLITYSHHKTFNSTTPNYAVHIGNEVKWANKTLSPFKGWLAEWIQINQSLSEIQRLKLESYLSIKYGFTLANESIGFINSNDEVLYSPKTEQNYFHRVFALAKDSLLGLDQRQSQSSLQPNVLSVALESHKQTNAENTHQLAELNYIFFGDDNQPLKAENKPINQKWKSQRNWKITANENINQAVEFTVALDSIFTESQQKEKPTIYLVLDKDSLQYIKPKKIENGIASFSLPSIVKGESLFSFAMAKKYFVDFSSQINQCSQNDGVIDFTSYGLTPPLNAKISKVGDENSNKIVSFSNNKGSINGFSQGLYNIVVTDVLGNTVEDKVTILSANSPIKSQNIQNQYTISPGFPLDFSLPSGYTYQWKQNNQLISVSNAYSIDKSGNYQLTVANDKGCQWMYGFEVERQKTELEPKVIVYPNPSKGNYFVTVTLPENTQQNSVKMQVYDVHGKLLSQKMATGDVAYRFEGYLPSLGLYLIHIIWQGKTFTQKLLIEH